MINRNFAENLLVLYFLSLLANRFYIDIGFALSFAYFFLAIILVFLIIQFRRAVVSTDVITISVAIFYLFACFTGLYSINLDSSLRFLFGAILLFVSTIAASSFSISNKVSLDKVLNKLVRIYLLISLFSLVYGLVIFNAKMEHHTFGGLLVEKSVPRLVGLTIDPNFAALTYIFCFFYLLSLTPNTSFRKSLILISFILTIATLSRSAMLALFLGVLVYVFMRMKYILKYSYYTVFGIGLLTPLVIYLDSLGVLNILDIVEKRTSGLTTGAGRFELWANALELFSIKPLLGHGIFSFRHVNMLNFGVDRYAHNTFLEVLVETGVVGFVLFMLIQFSILFKAYYSGRRGFLYPFYISFFIMSFSLSLYLNSIFIFVIIIFILLTNRFVSRS
ncbi:O-antigen ligase family protein [Vibrio vulnificus]|uniref:O-antigen ligase family protein n=1 Tax=Vibrio vulnificus TaxID=672 RepID=UPI001A19B0A8|nr:O-antigen ligase family protein [Vibrio vulnificus]MDK2644103.1 O-antigen ligase family protein [Vibrio vulnificus]MDK2668853.1 O-antigen ligase family protein [Vibrio vulnificus]HAS8338593.1 O-antigen ligase family protein [Vibrio vulnificus]